MNSSQKWTIGVVVGVVAVLVALALYQKPATAPGGEQMMEGETMGLNEPVRIGLLLPLTGDVASIGIPMQRAVLMAQEEINAAGGIAGQPVEIISEDGKCEPSAAAAAAQRLINVEKVKIVFGGACSGEMLAAAPIAEEAKVIIISPSATSPDITDAGDYVFRTIASDSGQGTVAAEYAYTTLGAKRVGVISEQTDYAQGLRKVFTSRFKELGGEVTADEVYGSQDTELRSQVLKIRSADVDLVYIIPQNPATTELILKQLDAQEVETKMMGSEASISRDLVPTIANLYPGFIGTEPYFDEKSEAATSFFEKYERKYNEKPTYPSFEANSYSQLYLVKEGIEEVGMDTEKLKEWLYTVKGWSHVLGELTFTEDGDRIGDYSVKEVQSDGTLKEVAVVRPQ